MYLIGIRDMKYIRTFVVYLSTILISTSKRDNNIHKTKLKCTLTL